MNNNEQLRVLLEDMRMQSQYSVGVTMPVPLYERIKATLEALLAQPTPAADALRQNIATAVDSALERKDVYEGIWDGDSDTAGLCLRIADGVIAALPALRPQQWLPITGELKLERKIAVTNNIGARNAHGEMNHVWLVDMVFASKERPGEYGAFDRNNRLYGLTHYADCLPAAPKQEG